MTKLILSLALVLAPSAFAATNDELANVIDNCRAETLKTTESLKGHQVELSLEESLKFFGSCVKENFDAEEETYCSPKDDRCYP